VKGEKGSKKEREGRKGGGRNRKGVPSGIWSSYIVAITHVTAEIKVEKCRQRLH